MFYDEWAECVKNFMSYNKMHREVLSMNLTHFKQMNEKKFMTFKWPSDLFVPPLLKWNRQLTKGWKIHKKLMTKVDVFAKYEISTDIVKHAKFRATYFLTTFKAVVNVNLKPFHSIIFFIFQDWIILKSIELLVNSKQVNFLIYELST